MVLAAVTGSAPAARRGRGPTARVRRRGRPADGSAVGDGTRRGGRPRSAPPRAAPRADQAPGRRASALARRVTAGDRCCGSNGSCPARIPRTPPPDGGRPATRSSAGRKPDHQRRGGRVCGAGDITGSGTGRGRARTPGEDHPEQGGTARRPGRRRRGAESGRPGGAAVLPPVPPGARPAAFRAGRCRGGPGRGTGAVPRDGAVAHRKPWGRAGRPGSFGAWENVRGRGARSSWSGAGSSD